MQNAQNHDRNFDRSGRTSRNVSDMKEDDGLALLSPKLEESVPSSAPSKGSEKGRALREEVGQVATKVGNGRTASAPAIPLRNQTQEHLERTKQHFQSKSDTYLRSRQSNVHPVKLESTQPQSAMSTTSIPIPGSKNSVPNTSTASPNTQRADKGSPRESDVDGNIEQWSPSLVMMMNQSGPNLLPFPCLETLSLINNLVSVCVVCERCDRARAGWPGTILAPPYSILLTWEVTGIQQ